MLRYIFLKLSGFTSKREFSISSSCNRMLMFRPPTPVKREYRREGRRNDQSKPQHKRSYSFPSRSTKSCRMLEIDSPCEARNKSDSSKCQGIELTQKRSSHQKSKRVSRRATKSASSGISDNSLPLSTSLSGKAQEETAVIKSKYHEMGCFDESDRYELEAARPRRSQSELVFNVFDYVAKDVDLTDYLQPSNLRPFGSQDNIYLPLLMSHKHLNVSTHNPNYLQGVTDIPVPERSIENPQHGYRTEVLRDVDRKETDKFQASPVNKLKMVHSRQLNKEIIKRQEELKPSYMSKVLSPKREKNKFIRSTTEVSTPLKNKLSSMKSITSQSLDRSFNRETICDKFKSESETSKYYKSVWSKGALKTEPPPFFKRRDDSTLPSISMADMGLGGKRNLTHYNIRVQPPWPAYSDRVKDVQKKSLVTYPPGYPANNFDGAIAVQEPAQHKSVLCQKRSISTENVKSVKNQPKALKKCETITSTPQRRSLSMEHLSAVTDTPAIEDPPRKAKSSIYRANTINKNAVTHSSISLNSKGVIFNPKHSYARSSKMIRKLEPKPCPQPPEKKKKCFLPSKLRLKPPKCMVKPIYDCPLEPECPPRADECMVECKKQLPQLKDNDCECVELRVPNENPKLKRLKMKFEDVPRICPCEPTECPCPLPTRADDCVKPKEKILRPYIPGECECVETPSMVNVPLVRLQKKCDPPEVCYPIRVCPEPEPCPPRADECLEVRPKQLPPINIGDCRCTELPGPNVNPKLRRLNMEFVDPPRVCPCEPLCECPEAAPVRADECMEAEVKKLPAIKTKCECVEKPPMVNVPLKRLQKVCIPEEVCWPKRECPVETCEDQYRADMCVVEQPKKLPNLVPSNCECYEPHMPDINPKLKRLKVKIAEEPRVCPCVPDECPCPPPTRADDCATPKLRKLHPYSPQECKCIEPPPMVNVPLIRLQKVCEPKEKCYPTRKPCIEETCEDKERADDCLVDRPRKLRPMEPKPCPCVDFKMKDGPKLKRLLLSVPEPPRICPIIQCPPHKEEKCWRADECVPEKVKKLRSIKVADCPCIDHPMTDVKLRRLKCKEEPEECLNEDPCMDFPRADWGCWEYLEDVEPDKGNQGGKNNDLNYKQKRKFNTDSTVSLRNRVNAGNARSKVVKSDLKKSNLSSDSSTRNLTEKISARSKYFSSPTKTNIGENSGIKGDKDLPSNKASSLPRCFNINREGAIKTITTSEPENNKTPISKTIELKANNSLPTLLLLKELNEMHMKEAINATINRSDSKSILTNLAPSSRQIGKMLSANVRKLSTVVVNARKSTDHCLGAAQASSSSKNEESDKPDKCKKKKPCKTMSHCPGPFITRNCPAKTDTTCDKKELICCEKKPTPNPAFSECMDDEIQPYSNTSQWSCDRKEYGFDPNPKKPYEPLDTVKGKKKFSTSAVQGSWKQIQNAENPIINYFSARYPKSGANGQSRKNSSVAYNSDFTCIKEKCPQLSNQQASYTTTIKNYKDMSMQNRGSGVLQLNSSGLLFSRPSLDQNTQKKNLSTLSNKPIPAATGEVDSVLTTPSRREFSNNDPKNDKNRSCKKKTCPKFRIENCPEATPRPTCKFDPPQMTCTRPQAPYPSFSELIDDELEDRMTECPIEKEKVQHLQPRYPMSRSAKLLDPILPEQGRIDPKIEETCVRERLCLQNTGLTQDCETFGDYIRPLKSKNFFKPRNTECEKIEELKKLGKWPRKNSRNFSTGTVSASNAQRRSFCSSARSLVSSSLCTMEEEPTEVNHLENESKQMSVRSYHALCKSHLADPVEEVERELYQNQIAEMDEPCKYIKLRNVQWRIDNFQKWHRLKKMSKIPHYAKGFHTCSKLKYRRFVRDSQGARNLSISAVKTHVDNLEATTQRGLICSKLKYRIFDKHMENAKRLSSVVKTTVGNLDIYSQRGISTTMMLAKKKKQKCIRFPLYPKPVRKAPKIRIPNCPQPMKPVKLRTCKKSKKKLSGSPDSRKIHLQPKYSSLPEVSVSVPSYQLNTDSSWGKECFTRTSEEEEGEGKTYDCSAVKKPFIRLNSSSSFEAIRYKIRECINNSNEKEDLVPCTPCGEVFLRNNFLHKMNEKTSGKSERVVKMKQGPKFQKPDPCDLSSEEPLSSHAQKVERCPKFPKPNPCELSSEETLSSHAQKIEQSECWPGQNLPEQNSIVECPPALLSLWEKIVNYFKARPNCPSPDEWKKKALREKAEKAAKAAGLALCEPTNFPQNVSKRADRGECKKDNNSPCFPARRDAGERKKYKSAHAPGCFPASKTPYKTSKRHYSNRVTFDTFEDLMEENKKKRLTGKVSQAFMDEVSTANEIGYNDDDVNKGGPDPFLENVLNEAIVNKNSLRCLENPMNAETSDGCLTYSLKMLPNDVSVLKGSSSDLPNETNRFNRSKAISDFHQYFDKVDNTLSDVTYEELEKAKTKTLVKELDHLLAKNQKSNKKN